MLWQFRGNRRDHDRSGWIVFIDVAYAGLTIATSIRLVPGFEGWLDIQHSNITYKGGFARKAFLHRLNHRAPPTDQQKEPRFGLFD